MTPICALDELISGEARRFVVEGEPVAVVRIEDTVYAIGDVCSHANVSLSDGEVWCDDLGLECPKHASVFSLKTGVPTTLPATQAVPVYAVSIVDNKVMVGRS